jgi:hypothetical protein
VAGCCECGDEPLGSCATELVSLGIYSTNVALSFCYIIVLPFELKISFFLVIFCRVCFTSSFL